MQLSKRYASSSSRSSLRVEELLHAFEMAEKSCPGIADQLVKDLLSKMLPNVTEARIRNVVDRMTRLVIPLTSNNCVIRFIFTILCQGLHVYFKNR